MDRRWQVLLVGVASIGTTVLAAWHTTVFVWARDRALVPFGVISVAPDWLRGTLFMSPVALTTSAIVAVVSTLAWKLVGVRSAARAGAAGLATGVCCALG